MPLPDAKPSARIYELLKTTDLENITFSQFQGVAEKIFAEQGAEDELRRIVLVNLARLSVVGEWTGLTTAGGGGGAFAKLINPANVTPTTYTDELMQQFFPYGSDADQTFTATTSTWRTFYYYFPFYANGDGKITDMRYKITSVHSGDGTEIAVVIYNTDDNGWPKTKLGTATLDLTATGNDKSATITETSTDSMTLTAGELYWIGYKENGTTGFGRIQSLLTAATPALGIQDQGSDNLETYNGIVSNTDPPPATWSNASDLISTTQKQIIMLGGPYV